MATLPVPRTWVSGEVITAAIMNGSTGVRDAMTFLLSPPLAVLKASAVQSIANTTFTPVLFDQEDKDSDGGHSTSVNTSRYTAQTAGWYQVQGSVGFAANATGQRIATLAVNGTLVGRSQLVQTVTVGGSTTILTTTGTVLLAVGDYVELHAYQGSGGSLNTSNSECRFQVRWTSTA